MKSSGSAYADGWQELLEYYTERQNKNIRIRALDALRKGCGDAEEPAPKHVTKHRVASASEFCNFDKRGNNDAREET